MKTVQNPNFAGRDLSVSGRTYTGDPAGVFEMEDEHADKVLGMRGWSSSEAAPAEPEDFDPVKALRETVDETTPAPPAPNLAPAPTVPAPDLGETAPETPQDAPEPEPTQPPVEGEGGPEDGDSEPSEDEIETEGPDLDAATTKKALYEIAKEWGVTLTADQKKLGVDAIRAILEREIYSEG